MAFEEINATIEVIAYFDTVKIRPLRFRWSGRVYRISQINHIWNTMNGRAKEYHFHVSTKESNAFELIFNNESFKWKIGRSFKY